MTPAERRVKEKKRVKQEKYDRKNKKKTFDWVELTDDLGGKVLTKKQIDKIRMFLEEKGIHLIIEDDIQKVKSLFKPADGFDSADELFNFLKEENIIGGAFDAENLQLILTLNPSEFTSFHELMHVRHYEEIGREAYLKSTKLDREMYVWKYIYENKNKWTSHELQEALDYINDIRINEFGRKPIMLK